MTLTQGPDIGLAPTGIDPYLFRGLLQRVAVAVAVVTTPSGPDLPSAGFTATSFTSVSVRPQLVSFCVDTCSASWPAVQCASYVAIHLLRAGQAQIARTFAAQGT